MNFRPPQRRDAVWWLAVIALVLACILIMLIPARCDLGSVQRAMSFLLRPNPAHRLARNPGELVELAALIEVSAREHQIPPLLWTAIIFRESSFKPGSRGLLGELGLAQVHGVAAAGCELATPAGQLDCGARHLRACADRCGDLRGGFSLYASGKNCRRDRWVVRDRWRLWQRLRRFEDGTIKTASGAVGADR